MNITLQQISWRAIRHKWGCSYGHLNSLFCIFLSAVLLPSGVHAQVVRPNTIDNKPPTVVDSDGLSHKDLSSSGILEDELAFTQTEKMESYTQYFHLALGYTRPWQIWSLGGGYLLNAQMHIGYFAGMTRTNEEGRYQDRSLDIGIASHSTGAFFRYYFQRFQHLFVESQVAYAFWNGDCSLNGTTTGGNSVENITVSYDYSGINLGGSVGVYWILGEHFVLEWIPLAVGTGFVLQRSTGRDSKIAESAIDQRLERPRLVGLMNLSLGYLF